MRRLSVGFAKTAANEQQIVRKFRGERAVTIKTAQSLRTLGLHNSQVLQHMVGSAIVRRAGPERYFLDEGVWAGRRSMSSRTLWRLTLAAAFGVAAISYYFVG